MKSLETIYETYLDRLPHPERALFVGTHLSELLQELPEAPDLDLLLAHAALSGQPRTGPWLCGRDLTIGVCQEVMDQPAPDTPEFAVSMFQIAHERLSVLRLGRPNGIDADPHWSYFMGHQVASAHSHPTNNPHDYYHVRLPSGADLRTWQRLKSTEAIISHDGLTILPDSNIPGGSLNQRWEDFVAHQQANLDPYDLRHVINGSFEVFLRDSTGMTFTEWPTLNPEALLMDTVLSDGVTTPGP